MAEIMVERDDGEVSAAEVGDLDRVLNDRDLITANPLLTVRDAARLMASRRVGAILVVEDGKLAGIFTERDLLMRVIAAGLDPRRVALGEVMTPDVITVPIDKPLREVMEIMLTRRLRHLPVVVEGKLAGMISQGDILKYVKTREGDFGPNDDEAA